MKSNNFTYDSQMFGLPSLGVHFYDFKNKDQCNRAYVYYTLARMQSMFQYDGLPDSIPQRFLELYLQTNGNVCITEVNGELRAFTGGIGGEPDIYYFPTRYIVANPRLKDSLNLEIGKDCIVIPSDSMYMGLLPLIQRYTSAMVENDLSLFLADVNTRVISLITAGDDTTKKAAETFLTNILKGDMGIVGSNAFFDTLKTLPFKTANSSGMTDLIEYQQYLKASLYNELGLQSNYNMKREAINSNEAQLNEDALLPLVDDMLRCRENGVKAVNEKYGTNITVRFNSTWDRKDKDNMEVSGVESENLSE